MSAGLHLLNVLLSEPDVRERKSLLRKILDSGITESVFLDEKQAAAFRYIREHFGLFGVVPQAETVQYETGLELPPFTPREPVEFWIAEVHAANEMAVLLDGLDDIGRLLGKAKVGKAKQKLQELSAWVSNAGVRKSRHEMGDLLQEVLAQHDIRQRASEASGVPIGLQYIDAVTGGAQRGDFWALIGDTGAGKTFILCRAAQGACDQGRRVLFVSLEMSAEQIGRRYLALGGRVDGTRFRLNQLSGFAMRRLREYADRWRSLGASDRFQVVEGNINMTVDDVLIRIRESQPDIVFIDGAYMLRPSAGWNMQRWEAVMASMERLKMIAMTERIPILASFQFQRDGSRKGLKGVGYSYSIPQLASVVLAIENASGGVGSHGTDIKYLTILKGRDGERGKVALRYDMRTSTIEQDAVLEGMGIAYSDIQRSPLEDPPEPDFSGDDDDGEDLGDQLDELV